MQGLYRTKAVHWTFALANADPTEELLEPKAACAPGESYSPWRLRFDEAVAMAQVRGVVFESQCALDWWREAELGLQSTPSGRCTLCDRGEFTDTTTLKSLFANNTWHCPCRATHVSYRFRETEVRAKAKECDLSIEDSEADYAGGVREHNRNYSPVLRCLRGGCMWPTHRNMTVQDLALGSGRHPCTCRMAVRKGARAADIAFKAKQALSSTHLVLPEVRVPVAVAVKSTLPTDMVIYNLKYEPKAAVETDGMQHTDENSAGFARGLTAGNKAAIFKKRIMYDRAKDRAWRQKGVSTLHVHQHDYGKAVQIIVAFVALIDAMGLSQSHVCIHAVTSPEQYSSVIPDDMKVGMLAYDSNTETFVPAVWT